MYKCKEIVVTIFKMSLKVHPQNKMLLRIQIHKWNTLDASHNNLNQIIIKKL